MVGRPARTRDSKTWVLAQQPTSPRDFVQPVFHLHVSIMALTMNPTLWTRLHGLPRIEITQPPEKASCTTYDCGPILRQWCDLGTAFLPEKLAGDFCRDDIWGEMRTMTLSVYISVYSVRVQACMTCACAYKSNVSVYICTHM